MDGVQPALQDRQRRGGVRCLIDRIIRDARQKA
jgi:hypothetical protein